MKDWISACLYQLAEPARNKDAKSRKQALIALSELHGITASRVVHLTLPKLEQVKAKIARHQM